MFRDGPARDFEYECNDKDSAIITLNVSLDLTFSARVSAMALSKLERIFMASCGSMRPSLIKSSIVSMRDSPMLDAHNGQLMFDKREEAMLRPERHTCCLDTVRNTVLAQSCCGLSTAV